MIRAIDTISGGISDHRRTRVKESRVAVKRRNASAKCENDISIFRFQSSGRLASSNTRKIQEIRRKVAHFLAGVLERKTR